VVGITDYFDGFHSRNTRIGTARMRDRVSRLGSVSITPARYSVWLPAQSWLCQPQIP
jgi:hypothetical protein